MGKIFYIIGKSSSGKDTIYEDILDRSELHLKQIILYTTRPIRAKETDGVQYHFVDEKRLEELTSEGRVIELRTYHVVNGIWHYFTVDEEGMNLENQDYLAIGTLESYEKLRHYYGEDKLVPLYIEVADDIRLERALKRERKQAEPNYDELCRRFLADNEDFSEKNIVHAGITRRFCNNGDRQLCMDEIAEYIYKYQKKAI